MMSPFDLSGLICTLSIGLFTVAFTLGLLFGWLVL